MESYESDMKYSSRQLHLLAIHPNNKSSCYKSDNRKSKLCNECQLKYQLNS